MERNKTKAAIVVGVLFLALLLVAVWFARGGGRAAPAPTVSSTATGKATTARSATTAAKAPTTARTTAGKASAGKDPESGLPFVAAASLPREAQTTLRLIDSGGPFPYPDKDGSTYRNLNKVLPSKADGYYKEYTVITPGESDRGARRIVAGKAGELYWTDDHYDSFARIQR